MRQFAAIIKKEFFHILRDKRTLLILLGMPVVQILIFGFALTNEVKHARIAVLDHARDEATSSLIAEISASRYFDIERNLYSEPEIEDAFRRSGIKMVMVFPPRFGEDLMHFNKAQVQLVADASDPNVANTLTNYASSVIMDYQQRITDEKKLPYTIRSEVRMLYNPQMKGSYSFVPGVMAMVLMLVCTLMTAITIVREKETGTMEVLLASPLAPLRIITAKAVPYLLLSAINIASILVLSVFVLGVPINGSLGLLSAESLLFTLTCLAFGLLISASTDSQQTAMFIALVGMFLPTLMLSGFMFPIENMPAPLQVLSRLVPATWYYMVISDVMIKGVGFGEVWQETLVLTGMLILLLGLAIKKFKIRLA